MGISYFCSKVYQKIIKIIIIFFFFSFFQLRQKYYDNRISFNSRWLYDECKRFSYTSRISSNIIANFNLVIRNRKIYSMFIFRFYGKKLIFNNIFSCKRRRHQIVPCNDESSEKFISSNVLT